MSVPIAHLKCRTYKCRAECQDDIARILGLLTVRKFVSRSVKMPHNFPKLRTRSIDAMTGYPDVTWVFQSESSLAEIKAALKKLKIPDIHVIMETLQPIKRYTGKRLEHEVE